MLVHNHLKICSFCFGVLNRTKKAKQTHFIIDCSEILKFDKLKDTDVNLTNDDRNYSAFNYEEQ